VPREAAWRNSIARKPSAPDPSGSLQRSPRPRLPYMVVGARNPSTRT